MDLLLDTRLPQAWPYNVWRLRRYAIPDHSTSMDETLHVCLTFDIEHDYDNPASSEAAQRFLSKYVEWASDHRWRGTLYVQGSLIPVLADLVRQAAATHEIGLHGLYHEVWGRSRWWQYSLGLASLSGAEKRDRLQTALELFKQANISRPRSFRAPYLNADRETLKILTEHGFTSDSSAASYLGALPVSRRYGGLWEIPVTADPRPKWSGSLVRYPELSMGSMLSMKPGELVEVLTAAVHMQRSAGSVLPPHLVLLAHPWEFEATPGVPHASAENWERLEEIIATLVAMNPATFLPITELVGLRSLRLSNKEAV